MRNKKINSKAKSVVQQTQEPHKGWAKENINVKYEQATEIGQFHGAKLYGCLADKFDQKIWHNALEKGFTTRAKGTNGVKYLDKKLLELKINDDARLYTKQLYKNTTGDYLAVFDKEANHKEIKKILNSTKEIHIDNCLDYPTSEFNQYSSCSGEYVEQNSMSLELAGETSDSYVI